MIGPATPFLLIPPASTSLDEGEALGLQEGNLFMELFAQVQEICDARLAEEVNVSPLATLTGQTLKHVLKNTEELIGQSIEDINPLFAGADEQEHRVLEHLLEALQEILQHLQGQFPSISLQVPVPEAPAAADASKQTSVANIGVFEVLPPAHTDMKQFTTTSGTPVSIDATPASGPQEEVFPAEPSEFTTAPLPLPTASGQSAPAEARPSASSQSAPAEARPSASGQSAPAEARPSLGNVSGLHKPLIPSDVHNSLHSPDVPTQETLSHLNVGPSQPSRFTTPIEISTQDITLQDVKDIEEAQSHLSVDKGGQITFTGPGSMEAPTRRSDGYMASTDTRETAALPRFFRVPPEVATRHLGSALPRNTILLQLEPPELGYLQVQVRLTDERLAATFWAESPAVRDLLPTHFPSLNQTLQEQGFETHQISITIASDAFTGQTGHFSHRHPEFQFLDHGSQSTTTSFVSQEDRAAPTETRDNDSSRTRLVDVVI